jgi:eukaryotic-like serine/threonine-protein kinase
MKLADLAAGVLLGGKFRLVEILGRGSYGDVWLADVVGDDSLAPRVALKIYHHQDRATRKLIEEAAVASGFKHDRLVQVFGASRIDGLVVMWMEYVAGETLLKRLGDDDSPRPVSFDEARRWLRDIADALAYLHVQDPPCVHGDLKLDNVLLDNGSGARLVDFGQSRTIEDRFVETDGIGAWPYLAPEVMGRGTDGRGQRYVSSDIYAFGVIAYRFLTGRFPRRTISEAINLSPFPRPVELNPSVPAILDAFVLKCLERRPEYRYPTGAALLAAIDHLQREMAEKAAAPITTSTLVEPALPRPVDELAELARELIAEGKVDDAIAQLERAMRRTATSPQMLLVYAQAAKRVGRLDAANAVYRRAISWLKSEAAQDHELRDPVEGLAELDVQLKKYEPAAEGFAWLAERWPEKRWYRLRYGIALGLGGRFRASIEVLRKLLDEGPRSALICAKLGLAYLQENDVVLACQYFNEALMLDEYEPTALFQMARIRTIQGNRERAERYLHRLEQVEGAGDQARELARLLGRNVGAAEQKEVHDRRA